jgi:hypothetical protein
VYQRLQSRVTGLTTSEAEARLSEHGPNVVAADGRKSIGLLVWHAVINPLVLLLGVLATISFSTGDARAGIVMSLMIALGVGLRLIQERRADTTAAKLKAMISVTATTLRDGQPLELPIAQLVPGDVVKLAAGDMIPADVRIVAAKDLFVIQGSLTGESFPVEKFEVDEGPRERSAIELANLAFLGTSVESGAATAVVVATGRQTYLGSMAESLAEPPTETAFDKGVARFTWLMVRFIMVMAPLVFLINGLTKGRWHDAFFFALARGPAAADPSRGRSGDGPHHGPGARPGSPVSGEQGSHQLRWLGAHAPRLSRHAAPGTDHQARECPASYGPGAGRSSAARYDDDLKRLYLTLLRRRGHAKARVAVARKLLVRFFIMLRDRIDYEEFRRRGRAPHGPRQPVPA